MPLHLSFGNIALRLAFTLIATALFGIDRGERGHTAGLRTTMLVGLAACIAMLQANSLLALSGKTPESFAVMDLMRLPLGILSGVGFLGGGAILRKEDRIQGLTTAACLWFITVVGLCFGGGQLGIGWAATGIGLFVVIGLRVIEKRVPRELTALLAVELSPEGPEEQFLRAQLLQDKRKVKKTEISYFGPDRRNRKISWQLHWLAKNPSEHRVPDFVSTLARTPGVLSVDWNG